MEDRDEEWQSRGEIENRGKKRQNQCVYEREREKNVEGLWVDKENAIYNGRGSGIDQNDCVL